MKCPHCHQPENQVKAGKTQAGSQRLYTPDPKPIGYSDDIRHQAIKLYVDGMNYRRIARHLRVDHQSVINWVKAYTAQLPCAPVVKAEMDELFTVIGSKIPCLADDNRRSQDELCSGMDS